MRSNLKRTGLALLAILALGALAAQEAAAANHKFKVGSAPAILTAEADPQAPAQVFNFSEAVLECRNFHADGTQSAAEAETFELLPQYSECLPFPGLSITFTNPGHTKLSNDPGAAEGGCKFALHGGTSANSSTSGVDDAPLDVKCEVGGSIEVKFFVDEAHTELLCSIKIGEQHGATTVNQALHGLKYNNVQTEGKPEEVTTEIKMHRIKYTSVKDHENSPLSITEFPHPLRPRLEAL